MMNQLGFWSTNETFLKLSVQLKSTACAIYVVLMQRAINQRTILRISENPFLNIFTLIIWFALYKEKKKQSKLRQDAFQQRKFILTKLFLNSEEFGLSTFMEKLVAPNERLSIIQETFYVKTMSSE